MMSDLQSMLNEMITQAKALHAEERRLSLQSVDLVRKFEDYRASLVLGMSSEEFAKAIDLTPSKYWKRAQAARVMSFFPKLRDMVLAGDTQISHVALLAPKITQANADLLLSGIKRKSTREVQELLSRITREGWLLEQEPEVEIKIRLKRSQLAKLDRAREVLSHGGKVPTLAEIVTAATEDLLERRDPLRKAKRSEIRKKKSPSLTKEEKLPKKLPSRAIPSDVRHEVWLRDEGQCTADLADGSRCPEKMMLELDHGVMRCRGGENTLENLSLKCRKHNQYAAEIVLGRGFMDEARLRGWQ